jgi:subtilisin family serine protease
MSGNAQKRTVMLLVLALGLLGVGTMIFGSTHSPAALTGLVTDNASVQPEAPAEQQPIPELQAEATPEPSFSTEAAAPRLVDPAVERALAENGTADIIIILKEDAASLFETETSQADALAQRKASVAAVRTAFAAEMGGGFGTASNAFEVTREYDTLNAIAATITSVGLEILKTRQSVEQIVLDRRLTVDLTVSVPLIDADDVWNLTVNGSNLTGKGEVICIIDTGIDATHVAFTNKILPGQDYVNEDSNPADDAGHGTHVSGIAAGNSSPVLGVAKDAKILPVKVCDSGGTCQDTDILAGIDFCNNNSATYNISAISGSLGDNSQYNSTTCPTTYDSIFATSNSLGLIPVFASGNNAFTNGISHPACSPYAISVGSTTKADAMSSFTNRGGDRLDVLAPGSSIVSALITGGTVSASGTSMATPHVSGAIALIQQNQRALNRAIVNITDMRTLLQQTGVNVTSWQRIDVYNAIAKLNQNYTINITDNSIANGTTRGAKVRFSNFTDMSRFVDCGVVRPNFVGIDSAACPQLNKSAHITFANITGIGARPLRNGVPCPPSICQNFTFGNGTVDFDVTEFSNYSSFNLTNLTGCANVNVSSVLTQNVSSTSNCINITGNNVILFCNGFTIAFDTAGGGLDNGIRANQRRNITVDSCIIRDTNAGGAGAVGIVVNGTNNSIFINNFIQVNGTANNNGFILDLFANNVTIANNTVNSRGTLAFDFPIQVRNPVSNITIANNTLVTVGLGNSEWGIDDSGLQDTVVTNNIIIALSDGGLNFGFRVNAVPLNLQVSDNNISVNGSGSYALVFPDSLGSTPNTTFSNNVLGTTSGWITVGAFARVNITNTTFRMPNGSITIPGTVQLNESTDVLISKLNISANQAYLNSTNLTALNTTAIIALNSVGFNDPKPQFRFGETGAFTDCTPTVNPFCTELGFSGGVFTFNVSHFTGYISAEGGSVNLTGCATVNASTVLTQNIASNDTCLFTNASNIVISCAGHTITYNANGSGALSDFGINVTRSSNLTITDCIVRNGNLSSTIGDAMSVFFTNYSTFNNISLADNGSNIGLFIMTSHNNTFGNDTVLTGSVELNAIAENNFTGNAFNGSIDNSNSRRDIFTFNTMNASVSLQSGDARLRFNNITVSGAGPGINTDPAGPFEFTGNRVEVNGVNPTAFRLAASNGNFTNNTFLANASGTSVAISIEASSSGNFTGNNFTARGTASTAIRWQFSVPNTTSFRDTVISSDASWIDMNPSGAVTPSINYTNTTFVSGNGSINIIGFAQLNNTQNVTLARLNISSNRAFLNTTNISAFNQTAVIALTGIGFTDPKPQVAFVDGGAFSDCSPTANPFCTEISYTGGVFTFNTSHFTSFDSAESTVTNCTLGPVLVNSSLTLAQDLTGNGTCLIANTNNIAIDCAGFAINFDRGGGFGPIFGIAAQRKTNISITSCIIRSINASGQNGYSINFSNVTQSVITNNTLIANGSNSIGIYIGVSSVGVNVTNNTIGASPIGFVVGVSIDNSSFINVRNSILIANSSTGPAEGIQATSNAQFIAVSNNSIRVLQTSGSQPTGFVINGGNATFAGNTVVVNLSDTSDATGISVGGGADFVVENNTIILAINTTDTINTKRAFQLASLSNAVVRNNTIVLLGSAKFFMGMLLSILSNVTIANTNITSLAETNTSLIVIDGVFGTTTVTLTNTTLSALNDPWIQQEGTAATSSNFTNTTFIAQNGSVQFPGLVQINGTNNVSAQRLNITANLAFLNSTNLTFLNQTAIIALKGIVSVSPKAQVAFVDGGAFSDCISTANPFCTNLSYAGGVFTFNTSHFTSYQSAESGTNITGCPITINVSTTLTQNLQSNSSCITFGNDSIALDCGGFALNGTQNGTGINATARNNISIVNCFVNNFTQDIVLDRVNNSVMRNDTARSAAQEGVLLYSAVNDLLVNVSGEGAVNRDGIQLVNSTTAGTNNTLIGVNGTSNSSSGVGLNIQIDNTTVNDSRGVSLNHRGIQILSSGNRATNLTGIGVDVGMLVTTGSFNNVTGSTGIGVPGLSFSSARSTYANNLGISTNGIAISVAGGNLTLVNNTGRSNATSGIRIDGADFNLTGNTGVSNTSVGIHSPLSFVNSIVVGNNGTGPAGISIGAGGGAFNDTFLNNVGTGVASVGFAIGGDNQTAINNTGTSNGSFGMQFLTGGDNLAVNNTGISTASSGIDVRVYSRSRFLNNTASSGSATALAILVLSTNNTFANTTLFTNATWIITDGTSPDNNITNTLFQGSAGSIRVFGLANIPGSANVSIARLNTSANRAFLNSTNLTFLNQTGQVTFTGATSNQVLVDFDDDNSFSFCDASICSVVSFAGGTLVVNVTHFTTFSSTTGNSNITLTKTDSPDPVNASSNLSYQISVNVTSDSPSNITLTDQYPAQVIFLTAQPSPIGGTNNTFIVGNLTANMSFTVNVTVLVLNITNGTVINNTANISFQNSTGSVIALSVTENTTVSNPPQINDSTISVTKTDTPDPVENGTQLNYTITVTVISGVSAFNVTVNDTYPSQVIFNSGQPSPVPGTNTTFILGNLSAGAVVVLNITVNVSAGVINGTVINNTVNVTFQNTTGGLLSALANASTTVQNVTVNVTTLFNLSNISVIKTDTPDPVTAGDILTYQINVTSNGNGTAFNVIVNDTYPAEVIAFMSSPPLVPGTNNTYTLGNLTPGTLFTINFSVAVRNITNGTVINNTVNVTFQNETGGLFSRVTTQNTTVLNPPVFNLSNVSVTKSDTPDPVENGTQLNYTITVTSTGNGTAFNTTVIDTYPAEVVFNTAQPTPSSGNNTFIIGNLTAGTVVVLNITVNVTQVANGTVINNTVNVTFQNESSDLLSALANTSTLVQNVTPTPTPPTPQGSSGGSGGGGGFSIRRNETVAAGVPAPSGPCVESWACEQWGQCQDASQARICVDLSQCGTATLKPATEQRCAITPLREQPIPVEPEQPAPVQVSAPVPVVVQEKSKSWTLVGILPVAIDVLLILFALIAMTHMLRYRSDRASGHWLAAVDIIGGITLIALVAHYIISRAFLPVEYITFVVLLLFVAVLRLAERGRDFGGAPRVPRIPALPDAPEEIVLEDEPAPKKAAIKAPKAEHKHAGPKKPLFSFFQPKPKVEDDMKDVFDSLDRISTLLERNKVTIRAPKKKSRVRKK